MMERMKGGIKARLILVLSILMIFALAPTQSFCSQFFCFFFSGNDLVSLMREHDRLVAGTSGVNHVKAREYHAYIIGAYDGTSSFYTRPHDTTQGQIVAIVSKYLKAHPEEWSEPAAELVVKALQEAFPLKGGK